MQQTFATEFLLGIRQWVECCKSYKLCNIWKYVGGGDKKGLDPGKAIMSIRNQRKESSSVVRKGILETGVVNLAVWLSTEE